MKKHRRSRSWTRRCWWWSFGCEGNDENDYSTLRHKIESWIKAPRRILIYSYFSFKTIEYVYEILVKCVFLKFPCNLSDQKRVSHVTYIVLWESQVKPLSQFHFSNLNVLTDLENWKQRSTRPIIMNQWPIQKSKYAGNLLLIERSTFAMYS